MTRTFGIEIEAFGLSLEAVARVVTAAGVVCVAQHYNHTTCRTWKVVSDASLTMGMGFELVSPILSGDEGLRQVKIVMDAIKAAGARVNKQTGLHVHIGARDLTIKEFRNIAKNYIVFEDFFDAIVPVSRRASNNFFIKSNRAKFGGYTNEAAASGCERLDRATTIDEMIKIVCGQDPHSDRYYKLNLTAFWRHGTIEFRQHSGTVEAEKALNWIKLLLQFVDRAKSTRQQANTGTVSDSVVFAQFFRCFKVTDLKPYYTARRLTLHPEA